MSELSTQFVIEKNPEKIKNLVRVGAIENEAAEVRIPLLEAAYWAEKGIINLDQEKILEAIRKTDKLADERYKILKYLTDLGHITRASGDGDYLRVHEKGIKRGEDRSRYVIKVVAHDWNPSLDEINKMLEFAGRVRKELLVGCVCNEEAIFLKIDRKKF